jgi:hypothetical protein
VGYLRPIACVLFFTTVCALVAVAVVNDDRRGPWAVVAGGLAGFYLGLIFGGVTTGGKRLDALFPPGDERESADP